MSGAGFREDPEARESGARRIDEAGDKVGQAKNGLTDSPAAQGTLVPAGASDEYSQAAQAIIVPAVEKITQAAGAVEDHLHNVADTHRANSAHKLQADQHAANTATGLLDELDERATTPTVHGGDLPGAGGDYPYNMVENPGPLADLPGNPAKNFAGGRYQEINLEHDTTLYRGGVAGTPLGQWFTEQPPESVAKVRIDTAVLPHWVDPKTGASSGASPIDTVYSIKIPAGTTIYEGPVANQGGVYVGGTSQIYVHQPWNIPGVEELGSEPLS